MRSCVSLIGAAVLGVALLVVGWFARDDIARVAARVLGAAGVEVELAAPTVPDLARRAEAKVIALGQGEMDEVTLTAEELNGWIEHGLRGFFPDFVTDLTAQLDADDRLVLSGRVVLERVPGAERLGPVALLLGDTAGVVVRGRVDGVGPGRGVYHIEQLQVGALPLPDAVRDELLGRLNPSAADGRPVNAVEFELPDFVTDIGVRGGELLLRSSRIDGGQGML